MTKSKQTPAKETKVAAESKAELDAKLAAEEEAKRLAEEERVRAEAEKEAAETKRLADEAEVQRKAEEEEARVKAEKEAADAAEAKRLTAEIENESTQSPLFADSSVAKAVGESVLNYLKAVRNPSLSMADRIKQQTVIVKVINNVPKIKEGKDCIASLDLLLRMLRTEIGEGGAFSEANGFRHAAQVQVPAKGIHQYQTFLTYIHNILGHLDQDSKVDYEKDFNEEVLLDVFPGPEGERLVAYARRACNVNK